MEKILENENRRRNDVLKGKEKITVEREEVMIDLIGR